MRLALYITRHSIIAKPETIISHKTSIILTASPKNQRGKNKHRESNKTLILSDLEILLRMIFIYLKLQKNAWQSTGRIASQKRENLHLVACHLNTICTSLQSAPLRLRHRRRPFATSNLLTDRLFRTLNNMNCTAPPGTQLQVYTGYCISKLPIRPCHLDNLDTYSVDITSDIHKAEINLPEQATPLHLLACVWRTRRPSNT